MLEFDCQENWDAMAPMSGGRFCAKCQHDVIDFTGWDRRSMIAYLKQHPGTCGQYRPDQLEPELIPLAELLSLKSAALVAGLTLGSIQVSAQAPEPPPTVQTLPISGADDQPLLDDRPPVLSEKPDGINGVCPRPVAAPTTPARLPNHRFYVSTRFPFFHVRKANYRGRVRRGRLIF